MIEWLLILLVERQWLSFLTGALVAAVVFLFIERRRGIGLCAHDWTSIASIAGYPLRLCFRCGKVREADVEKLSEEFSELQRIAKELQIDNTILEERRARPQELKELDQKHQFRVRELRGRIANLEKACEATKMRAAEVDSENFILRQHIRSLGGDPNLVKGET